MNTTNSRTGVTRDGRWLLAHFITQYYAHLHEPEMSLKYHDTGSLKVTGVLFANIRM